MGKVVRLTESQLKNLIKKVINESTEMDCTCLKKMGLRYNPPTTSRRAGPFGGNQTAYYDGDYQGSRAIFYTNGHVRIFNKEQKFEEKSGSWKCESGQLKVFNLGDWKKVYPM